MEKLRVTSRSATGDEMSLLQEAFYELNESLEELSVAEEELHVQTEQLQTSAAVIQTERSRYRQLFELAPDGYIVTDKLGMVQEANRAAMAMLGQRQRLVVGKPLSMFVAEDSRREFRDRLSELRQQNRISNIELILKPAAGHLPFHASLTIGCDGADWEQTNVIRWIVRDITEQKRAQARLVALNRELEEKVRERTCQLEAAYNHEHRIADTLQQALLHAPAMECDGLCVDAYYEAALDEAGVGGDFYDVFRFHHIGDDGHASDRLAVVIGDVSGKGLNAAVCAASVKYTLRALMRLDSTIEDAVTRLNRFICKSKLHGDWTDAGRESDAPQIEVFVVLAVCVFDPAPGGDCQIVTAGGEPAIVLKPDGTYQEIWTKSIVLGISDDIEYRSARCALSPGDLVVMATDGITESRIGDEFFGIEGIVSSLRATHGYELSARTEHVVTSARNYSHGPFKDDVCMVMAERQ